MRLRRKRPLEPPATGHVGDHADKLGRVRPIPHDEDERQSTQDRGTYHSPIESIFEPVPLPDWLRPRRQRRRKRST
jgi:hypothetical protein